MNQVIKTIGDLDYKIRHLKCYNNKCRSFKICGNKNYKIPSRDKIVLLWEILSILREFRVKELYKNNKDLLKTHLKMEREYRKDRYNRGLK